MVVDFHVALFWFGSRSSTLIKPRNPKRGVQGQVGFREKLENSMVRIFWYLDIAVVGGDGRPSGDEL